MNSNSQKVIYETFEKLAQEYDWSIIKSTIKKHQIPLKLMNELLFLLGSEIGQEYGYSIIKLFFEGKDLRDVAEFIYNDLCDQDIYHVSEFLGGYQNTPEIEYNIEGKKVENGAIFVFGNDADGAKKISYILTYLQSEYSLGWDDLIMVIATALKNWELLDPSDRFLQLFLLSVSKELTVDEVIKLISKIIDISDGDESQKDWICWNKKLSQFFLMLTQNWNLVDKSLFFKNGPVVWQWSNESIKQLNKFFKIK